MLEKEGLCFDIGANKGYKSLMLLSLNHKVIAFEPQSNCQDALLKIEKQQPDFKVVKVAIGSDNTELDLFIGNHIEIATLSNKFREYFKTEKTFWNAKERVKVVTLNSQIKSYGLPYFCKIDAEGSEYEILKKLSYKIPVLEFEFTGGFIKETILCIDKIASLGNYKFNYILNENPKWKLEHWMSSTELIEVIKDLKNSNLHGNIFAKIID